MSQTTFTDLAGFQPKQRTAWYTLVDPLTKYFLFGGAMGPGKSYTLRWSAVGILMYFFSKYGIRGAPVGLFSEDYPTLKDRQISKIEREFPSWLGRLRDSHIDGLCYELAPEYGEGKILLRNLDDPSKYMSTEFAAEFVEELTKNTEQTFMDLRNRLRYPGIDQVKFMGSTNPGGIGHGWVKKYFIDKKSGDREQDRFFYLHSNVYDNKYISPEYIKQLESLPEQQRKAYLDGSWDVFAGQYFTEFNERLHKIGAFLPNKKNMIIGGMDWGRAFPFVLLLAELEKVYYQTPTFDVTNFYRVRVFCEIDGIERTPAQWNEIIQERLKTYNLTLSDISWIAADPAMFNKLQDKSVSLYDQFYQADNRWRIMRKASNDRKSGWQNVHKWLAIAPDGKPFVQFSQLCGNTIRTIPLLIHDDLDREDVESSRKDNIDDDWGDTSRYLLSLLKHMDGKTGQITRKSPQGVAKNTLLHPKEDMGKHLLNTKLFK